jgi:hypothetical protein
VTALGKGASTYVVKSTSALPPPLHHRLANFFDICYTFYYTRQAPFPPQSSDIWIDILLLITLGTEE